MQTGAAFISPGAMARLPRSDDPPVAGASANHERLFEDLVRIRLCREAWYPFKHHACLHAQIRERLLGTVV